MTSYDDRKVLVPSEVSGKSTRFRRQMFAQSDL